MGAHLELLGDLGLRHQAVKKQLRSRDNWHHKCNVEKRSKVINNQGHLLMGPGVMVQGAVQLLTFEDTQG